MGVSYVNQLIEAMRELLPGQFFRVFPCTEIQIGRHNVWRGPGCLWDGANKGNSQNVSGRCAVA
jgi:hypothetical protein